MIAEYIDHARAEALNFALSLPDSAIGADPAYERGKAAALRWVQAGPTVQVARSLARAASLIGCDDVAAHGLPDVLREMGAPPGPGPAVALATHLVGQYDAVQFWSHAAPACSTWDDINNPDFLLGFMVELDFSLGRVRALTR